MAKTADCQFLQAMQWSQLAAAAAMHAAILVTQPELVDPPRQLSFANENLDTIRYQSEERHFDQLAPSHCLRADTTTWSQSASDAKPMVLQRTGHKHGSLTKSSRTPSTCKISSSAWETLKPPVSRAPNRGT
eukprot:186534-Amphidinium_carterae.1